MFDNLSFNNGTKKGNRKKQMIFTLANKKSIDKNSRIW